MKKISANEKFIRIDVLNDCDNGVVENSGDVCRLVYVHRGMLNYLVSGKSGALNTGEMLFVASNSLFRFVCNGEEEEFTAVEFLFSKEYMADYFRFSKGLVLPVKMSDITLNAGLCGFLLDNVGTESSYDEFYNSAVVNLVLSKLLNEYEQEKPSREAMQDVISKALGFLEEHYAESVDLNALCAYCGDYSREYLSTEFNRFVGENMNKYLNRFRADRALKLIESGVSAPEAANRCGFFSKSSFYRALGALKKEKCSK